MEFDNVLRHFGDISQLDPAMSLANKINDMVKEKQGKELTQEDINNNWKILRYIYRSKNPRLYSQLAKTVILKL
jgi:hypothetical protein